MMVRVSPAELVRQAIADVRGFAVEKYGIPPETCIVAPAAAEHANVACVPPLVLYVLGEVLKNAVTALEARHGVWDLNEALPVTILVRVPQPRDDAAEAWQSSEPAAASTAKVGAGLWDGGAATQSCGGAPGAVHQAQGTHAVLLGGGSHASACAKSDMEDAGGHAGAAWEVEILDYAGGVPEAQLPDVGRFFYSTVQESPAAGYGYLKDHGAVCSGLGVGFPMARMYAEMMGGTLLMEAHEDALGRGARVTLQLPLNGFFFQC